MSAKRYISADVVWRTNLNEPFGAETGEYVTNATPSGQIRGSFIVVFMARQRAQRYMFQRCEPGNIIGWCRGRRGSGIARGASDMAGPKNLSPSVVRKIFQSEEPGPATAKRYKVSTNLVYLIRGGRIHKEITMALGSPPVAKRER
jgi:hypothetical protein